MSQPLFERYKDALRQGHVAVIDGRLDEAMRSYGDAAVLAPDRALPHASIATVLHRLGRSDEAIAAFDRALALAPDDDATRRARAVALEEMGREAMPPPEPPSVASLEIAPPAAATRLAPRIPDEVVEPEPAAGTEPTTFERAPSASGPSFGAPGPYLPFEEALGDGQASIPWPAIDLPSPPPPPIVGPPPDPRRLVEEAEVMGDAGNVPAARDLLLSASKVYRSAGRRDAALDACLQLLALAPGDPQAHLALAGLQLDQGWRGVATDKIALLLRLTALTGDTQAEADTHALAAERLRDEPAVPAG